MPWDDFPNVDALFELHFSAFAYVFVLLKLICLDDEPGWRNETLFRTLRTLIVEFETNYEPLYIFDWFSVSVL